MKVKIIEKEVLNPLAEKDAVKMEVIPISDNIRKISLFDNTKPNADVILDTIRKNFDVINFFWVKKPAGAPATSQQIEMAAEADVSILAAGDCGSCTTWVILDAIRLEKRGTPTISICSDRFVSFAHELAESNGIESLRIVEIEHPIAGLSGAEVREKTLKIIHEVKTLLNLD